MSFKKGIRFDFWSFVGLISLITFGLFLIFPVGRMVVYSFQSPEGTAFTFDNFVKFFTRAYYMDALKNSVWIVLCASVLVIVIGVPLAYITTSFQIRAKRLIDILIVVSMLSPPFLGAYSWILMLGRNGVITKFFENIFSIKMPSIYGPGGISGICAKAFRISICIRRAH